MSGGRFARLEHVLALALQSRRNVGLTGALMLLALFLLGVIVDDPTEPGAVLYAIPVVLVAIALGPVAGVGAGFLGTIFFSMQELYHDDPQGPFEISYRLGALVLVGLFSGVIASQLDRSNRERSLQLALDKEFRARAIELNDEVVQGLAATRYLLGSGDEEAAVETVTETLERAKELVADLIGDVEIEAGALRRGRPADAPE